MASSNIVPSTSSRRLDLAALDIALAIGAQTQPYPDRTVDCHIQGALFSRAQKVGFEGMLARPSLPMVRLFILMAFYSLGTCQRTAASMYLGVACNAGDVLGLPEDTQQQTPSDGDASKWRIVSSLNIVNVLASFILGRRQSSQLGVPVPSAPDGSPKPFEHRQTTFTAILQGCGHIEEIVRSLRGGPMLHIPTAERLLKRLREWTQGLSEPVRQFTFGQTTTFDSADRQTIVGHSHLSCVYYFAVLLITRPFLIAYLLSRLRGRAPDHLIDNPDEATDMTIKNSKVSKMAQVCVRSATCMIESLLKVKSAGFTFGNLCLLK